MAATETMTYQDTLNSQYLSSSLSSLSNSRSTNSLIVRTYKQATQLYLTRRFREALEAIEPIVSPQQNSLANGAQTNGHANGYANEYTNVDSHTSSTEAAPIAQSSRSTRTKIWVFYLSLLHAIIELGPEEGRQTFGSSKWKQLATKVRDGTVWDEVVQRGYGGEDGDVDADVVVNLATLLLGHMQHQKLNQQRLETYLAASDDHSPNGRSSYAHDGMSTPLSTSSSSPRTLATRLKILELYTLHVLPANEEWGYSQSFIEMSDTLDEERKEAFMAALQNLREEKDGTAQRARELQDRREREMEQQRHEQEQEEARRADEARKDEERRKEAEVEKQEAAATKATNGHASTPKPTPTNVPARPARAQKKPRLSASPTFYRRATSMLSNLQQTIVHAGQSLNGGSIAMLRFLMFMLAFLLVITRRDLRLRLRRAMQGGWAKVKQTIGMGIKVSYV